MFLIFGTPNRNVFQNSHKTVMLTARDLFDFLVFCTPHHKTVILSEAPRGSIAQQRVYSA
jgi:hypothetical protein